MSLLTLLLVLLLAAVLTGGFAHPRWGYVGWSPAGIILLVLLVLLVTGNLR